MLKIDMLPFANSPYGRLFLGVDMGLKARKQMQLNELDKNNEIVTLVFPDSTWAITSSFFLAAFSESVRKLGEEEFKKKYQFVGPKNFDDDIRDGIHRSLKYHKKEM